MALVKRTIQNTGSPLVDAKGTVIANTPVTFVLVNKYGTPTDSWDILTDERVISTTIAVNTTADGEFSVDLWPNDRGNQETFYCCSVPGAPDFTAALVSGAGSISWSDFKANGSPLASDAYDTPLYVTAGDTLPISSKMVDNTGGAVDLTGYSLLLLVTDSVGAETALPIAITDPAAGLYEIDLSGLTTGRYSAKMRITNASLQVITTQPFVIEVSA